MDEIALWAAVGIIAGFLTYVTLVDTVGIIPSFITAVVVLFVAMGTTAAVT
ncbi:hypothetical protein [Haloplanus natans]|uniref:hypothetical protein n=1 Tax=Haloplanus natans TaxID=376171 RepID=UPI0012F7215B|nr:hypothetical protein [Haloplanus natans]